MKLKKKAKKILIINDYPSQLIEKKFKKRIHKFYNKESAPPLIKKPTSKIFNLSLYKKPLNLKGHNLLNNNFSKLKDALPKEKIKRGVRNSL